MPQRILVRVLFILALLLPGAVAGAAPPSPEALLLISLGEGDLQRLDALGAPVYARFHSARGPRALVGAREGDIPSLQAAGLQVMMLPRAAGVDYYVAYPMRQAGIDWDAYAAPLFVDERVVLLQATEDAAQRLAAETGARVVPITLTPKATGSAAVAAFPPVTAPDAAVADMVGLVNEAAVRQYTGDLSGEWPVTVDGATYTIASRNTNSGPPIQKATQYTGEHLAGHDLNVEYHRWGPSAAPNVIGELPGETAPDDIYMITAHLDDMPSGSTAPGADDNASGSVAVLVASDILSQHRWSCTLRFAFWTGEEQGLLGSDVYATRSKVDLGEDILGVLNLDMIAWNTAGSTPEIDLHADAGLPPTVELAQQFVSVLDTYGMNLVPEVRQDGTGASDHASFWGQGYTAILGIEDYYPSYHDFNPYYHTVNDKLNKLDMAYYTEFVKASVAAMAHMTGCRVPGPAVVADSGAGEVGLEWPAGPADAAYEVHRSTDPYFDPQAGTRQATVEPPFGSPVTWLDPTSGAGDPAINHFYQVRALNGAGRGAASNRPGEFDFTLTPGG